jgi:hypothetical protein
MPLLYKIINALGKPLVAANLPALRLDERSVCATATRRAGLEDFGHPHYRPGLLRLLGALEQDAHLHPIGRYMAREIVVNYLVQRLRLVETRKSEPALFETLLRPPLLITGLARSGTTFLHNMLALDPAHRALPQWLLYQPFPDPRRTHTGPDSRIKKMEQNLPLHPGLDAIHYTRADTYEECIVVLGLTLNSLIFSTLLPVHRYTEWYIGQEDTRQKYQEYRWLLHWFQSQAPERRLTVKAPAHCGYLEELTHAVPELLLIQTHRAPETCISSACSLTTTFHHVVAHELDLPWMSDLMLQVYEFWLRRNLAFREEHPDRIYDVSYDALVADPVGTVRGIYAHYGLPWTDLYATKLDEYIESHPKGKHGAYRYTASDYGLTEDEIAEQFRFYSEHFGL